MTRPVVPYAADETTTLRAFLDLYRDVLLRKAEGLSAEQLARTLPPSTLHLAGLLKHMAYVEGYWLGEVLLDAEPVPPFADVDWDADNDWEFTTAAGESPEVLTGYLRDAIARSDATLDRAGDLGARAARVLPRRGEAPTLRWILVHLIEEYARHCGHADLIRESIDGATGF